MGFRTVFSHGLFFFGFVELELELEHEQKYSSSYLALSLLWIVVNLRTSLHGPYYQ
jgi:hypothetical protein